jgi:hypothetical protein
MGIIEGTLGALGVKAVYDKGKKSGKKKSEANLAQKQSQIDALKKQNEDLQSQVSMNRGSMFSDLGFQNKKPDGTSGGMLPM